MDVAGDHGPVGDGAGAGAGAGADAGVGAGADPGGAAASSSSASSAASSTKKRTRAIKFDESYVPDAPQNQQAERFVRDANGYALDATGARLALQPPDVSLRVAKKLGLQDPAVSALDRYTRCKKSCRRCHRIRRTPPRRSGATRALPCSRRRAPSLAAPCRPRPSCATCTTCTYVLPVDLTARRNRLTARKENLFLLTAYNVARE